jgi:hypothetical protein
MITILVLVAIIAILVAAFPGARRARRGEMSWTDAGVKAIVIFLVVTVATVFIPSYVMQHEKVAALDRTAQDLIGATIWTVALVAVLMVLRIAQREGRV